MANRIKFSKHDLDMIVQRLSLVDFVAKSVTLKRKGNDFWGCCPFHGEKTPSFHVREDKKYYHCFGCGAHGNIFSFAQHVQGGTFPEVVEYLAEQAGIKLQIENTNPEKQKQIDQSYHALEKATQHFELRLQNNQESLQYLLNRGLSEKTIKTFRLGFAKDSWSDLKDSLTQQGISQNALLDNGLVVKSDKGGYDRFRNRVMFPIENYKNQVIAFGGRVLDDTEPKYLNSPETQLFNKSYNLFALNKHKEEIRKANKVFVVEGYMDVIGLHNSGLKLAVAPLGTAITEGQLLLLWKYNNEPVICLDGDSAGQSAAFRAAKRALPILQPGRTLKFMEMPEGEDPDSFVKSNSVDDFLKLAENSYNITDCIWKNIIVNKDLANPDDRALIEQEILSLTSMIKDATIARQYKTTLIEFLFNKGKGLSKHSVLAKKNRTQQRVAMAKHGIKNRDNDEQKLLLALSLQYPEYILEFEDQISSINFENHEYQVLQKAILEFLEQNTLDKAEFNAYLKKVSLNELQQRILNSCEQILKSEQIEKMNQQEIAKYWIRLYNQLRDIEQKQSVNNKFDFKQDFSLGSLESDLRLMEQIKKYKIKKES